MPERATEATGVPWEPTPLVTVVIVLVATLCTPVGRFVDPGDVSAFPFGGCKACVAEEGDDSEDTARAGIAK